MPKSEKLHRTSMPRKSKKTVRRKVTPRRPAASTDLTWLFWTKLCEKLSLERSFGYAEEEVQR